MRIAQNVRIRKFPGEIDDHTTRCGIQKNNIQDVTMLQL